MNNILSQKLNTLPKEPGVYFFRNKSGNILYIGKAKNLKNRVKSYFQKNSSHNQKTEQLIKKIEDLDYMVVSSETESLMLETTMIKKHKPPFNILMRDDKNYQYIKIDYQEKIPQIYSVRRIDEKNQNAKYFGPFTSGLSVKRTLKFIKRTFKLCQNKKISNSPCFAYHLGKCDGVCIEKISPKEYQQTLKQVERFLAFKQKDIQKELRNQMTNAAKNKKFEKAAIFRDRLRALEKIWEKQKIISKKPLNQDFVGMHRGKKNAFVNIFLIRQGKLIHQEKFELQHDNETETNILSNFLSQYYLESTNLPKTIYIPLEISNTKILEKSISNKAGKKIQIKIPKKGEKLSLVKLAEKNATLAAKQQLPSFKKQTLGKSALDELKKALDLHTIPKRIEGYDISNIQGSNPVGSMVVFENAKPKKTDYRKFSIQEIFRDNLGQIQPNDFMMMQEILTRRLKYLHDKKLKGVDKFSQIPDLLVIDGGKAQLNAVLKILKYNRLEIPTIGLAKRLEEIFIPGRAEPVVLRRDSEALKLLQQIRDEAHRFAITYHKNKRSENQIKSILDEIPGIGPKTKKALLKKFGTIKEIRLAENQQLEEIIGPAKAKILREHL